jgi:hypothetical protein
MTTSDESDLRQLSWSIAAGVKFFVTLDGDLLKKDEQIYDRFGMHIVRPSDLVINQDQHVRETEYQPARLAGSRIRIERVRSDQVSLVEETFHAPQEETKAEFRRRVSRCLAQPHTFQTEVIQSAERLLALVACGRENQHELEIPVFRMVRDPLSTTLARHLVLRAVLLSCDERRVLTRVTDPYLSADAAGALREMGFVFLHGAWIRGNLAVVETVEELALRLELLGRSFPEASQYFGHVSNTLRAAQSAGNIQTVLRVERALWPAKMIDIDVPAFVVPIRPVWAMHLFDPGIANQDLFGGKPSLVFSVENVYYRARRPRVVSAPARILWYVSKGRGRYRGTMAIRACSYLDEVVVDKPKVLFSRFRRLGVYRWEDVLNVAKEKMEKEIMAFRFGNTEVFSSPVYRDKLQMIWEEETGRNFHIQGPISIPKERFFRLYRMGIEAQ